MVDGCNPFKSESASILFMNSFNALIATEVNGEHSVAISQLTMADLPEHPVIVKVSHSTLNYKDALAVTGKSKICRQYPMVCGIDLAGEVVESSVPEWQVGDAVLVNGYGLSEMHWGGYTQYQRLKPEWLVRIPEGFTAQDCMAIGTAGYTAMLCVLVVLDAGVQPSDGPVLVTGASGGVGSFAISLLNKLGYTVTACTGSASEHAWLSSLGASSIIDRAELSRPAKPLEKETWSATIDSVGGQTLACAISQTQYNGVVAACGLAGGIDLPATVMPFILRNVRLQGVDSVQAPMANRVRAWQRLSELLTSADLTPLYEVATLEQVPELAAELLGGSLSKRRVIRMD